MRMQTTIISLLSSFLLATGLGASSVDLPSVPPLPSPIPVQPPLQLCSDRPDLSVQSQAVTNQGRQGWIHVCTPIKNSGGATWSSDAAQLGISVSNSLQGTASLSGFASLAAGSSTTKCGWVRAPGLLRMGHHDPQPGECKATMTVNSKLVFDPDISLDGNTANDDCLANNNSRSKTVSYMAECPG